MLSENKVVLFTGAGCSYALDVDKFPTTQGLIERIENENDRLNGGQFYQNEFYQMAIDSVQKKYGDDNVDIERLIIELLSIERSILCLTANAPEKLENLYSDTLDTGNYLYKIFETFSIPKFKNSYTDFQTSDRIHREYDRLLKSLRDNDFSKFASLNDSGRLQGEIRNLINSICSMLHEIYGVNYFDNNGGDFQDLVDLLRILGEYDNFKIFTTNYDFTIERSLDFIYSEDNDFQRIYDGINREQSIHYLENIAQANEKRLYVKLHGSIDMVLHDERICVGPPKFYNFEDQYIAYPEEYITSDDGNITLPNKNSIIANAINRNLKEFKDSVANADFILFIGFSFRNEHINSILDNNLNEKTFVFVINPEKSNLHLPNCLENRFYRDRDSCYDSTNSIYMADGDNFCHYFKESGFDSDIISHIKSYINRGYYAKTGEPLN